MATNTFTLGPPSAAYTNLESAPAIAQQIGLIFASFAMVETEIPRLYSWITRISVEDANSSLNALRSFGARLTVVEAALTNHLDSPRPHLVAKCFCARSRTANSIRNLYAHAHYRFVSPEEVDLLPYGDHTRKRRVTAKDIEADVDTLRSLSGDFFQLFRQGRVPQDLFEELQKLDPEASKGQSQPPAK